MARTIAAFFVLCAAFLMSAALAVSSLTFTAGTVAQMASLTPVRANIRPSYVASTVVTSADDLNVAKSVPAVPVSMTTEPPPGSAPAFIVAVDSLRVRSSPAKDSPQVFGLHNGAMVTVSGTERGWMLITAEDGRTGWVYGKFLRPAASGQHLADPGQLQAQLQ